MGDQRSTTPGPQAAPSDRVPLLCERCGYELVGLPDDASCPECGAAVADSLPDRRTGSPFQNCPRFGTLGTTWWRALRRRAVIQREIRVDATHARRLAVISCVCATVLVVIGASVSLLAFAPVLSGPVAARLATLIGVVGLVLAPLLLGLTELEAIGLRLISKQRGWRVDRKTAETIVAHGCVGWVVAGLAAAVGLTVFAVTHWLAGVVIERHAGAAAPTIASVGNWIGGTTMVVGVLCGFLYFEWFAYTGVRRCRFANPPTASHKARSSA